MRHGTRSWLVAIAAIAMAWCSSARAEMSTEQAAMLAEVNGDLVKVVELYRGKKFDELSDLVAKIEGKLAELSAAGPQEEMAAVIPLLHARLEAARRLLLNRDIVSADGPSMAANTPAPGRPTPTPTPTPRPTTTPPPAGGQVSFVRDVAPIFLAKCNNCHVRGTRGDFSMASYADLMRGTPGGGPVFRPGKGEGSTLHELISTGAMPPNGNSCSADEVATITRWINEGAKFDGPDPTMSLAAFGAGSPTDMVATRATGNESVQFLRDLAPVIVENCTSCHSGQRPSENLQLATFSGLLRGGRSGLVVNAGNPAGSVLIQKLKGTQKLGAQMPLQGEPLSADIISKFETWISEGARFDGSNPDEPIEVAVRVAMARRMSPQELSAYRADRATRQWLTGNPDVTPDRLETDNFLILGNVGPARLTEVAESVEEQLSRVSSAFRLPANQSLVKGKITIFVFSRRFEYTEFALMVEKREAARDQTESWFYNLVDAYAAIYMSDDSTPVGKSNISGQIATTLTGIYLDSLQNQAMPRWFVVGAARRHSSRMESSNPQLKQWDDSVAPALAAAISSASPDAFMNTNNLDSTGLALSYGFVGSLMSTNSKYQSFLGAIKNGQGFDRAFRGAWGADPKTALAAWIRSGGR